MAQPYCVDSIHREKERIRHQKLQSLLNETVRLVPKICDGKVTKCKKLRKILVYSAFLKRKLESLESSLHKDKDIPASSDLNSVKENKVIKRTSKAETRRAQIVYLQKSSNSPQAGQFNNQGGVNNSNNSSNSYSSSVVWESVIDVPEEINDMKSGSKRSCVSEKNQPFDQKAKQNKDQENCQIFSPFLSSSAYDERNFVNFSYMSGTDHYKNTSKSAMLSSEFMTEDVSSKDIVYNIYEAIPFPLESDGFMSYDVMPNSEFTSQFIPNGIAKKSDNLSVIESPVSDLIKMKNLISQNEGPVIDISKQGEDCIDLKSSLNRKLEYLDISKQTKDCINYKSSLNNTFDFVKESNRNSSIKQHDENSEEYLNILKEGQDFINFKPSLNNAWALVNVSNKISSVDQQNENSERFTKKSMFCNSPTSSENISCFKADFFLPIKENISYNENLSPSVPLIGDDSNSELNCLQPNAQVNILNPMLNAYGTYRFLDGETHPNSNEKSFQHSSSTSTGTETFENNSEGNYELSKKNYSKFGRSVSSHIMFPENKNYSEIIFQLQDNSTSENRNMNWFENSEKALYTEPSNVKKLIPIPYDFSSVCNSDFCSNSDTKMEWEDISNNVEVCEDTKNHVEEYDNSGSLLEENDGINAYIEEYVDPVLFNNSYGAVHPEMNSCRAFPNMFKIPSDSIPYLPKEETSFNLNHIESSDLCYENVNGM